MAICSTCTDNVYLRQILLSRGGCKYCSTCFKEQPHVFDISELAALLRPIIRSNFCVYDDDERLAGGDHIQGIHYFELSDVVAGILHQDVDFRDDLVDLLVQSQGVDPFCTSGFFDAGHLYMPIEELEVADTLTNRWNGLVDELKYQRRFFSESVRSFFDAVFGAVENITSIQTSPTRFQRVVRHEDTGLVFYRSRIVGTAQIPEVLGDPYKHVGPVPKQKSRAGRMNAEGVVVLYCSMEEQTAIAELRPAIGQISAVIELHSSRPLRLLDFRLFERALDDGWAGLLDPQREATLATRKFLRTLHALISKPVVPGKEADYLITQTMSEYLAYVRQPGFDGIVFGSAQRRSGTNVVIFADSHSGANEKESTFPVEYVSGSLEFYGIQEIQYVHSKIERAVQGSLWGDE